MHLGTAALLKFLQRHQDDNELVLATIHSVAGSTYRKPGAMMLIAADDTFEGMISGGCLEGDLLHHAQEVFTSGEPKTVTYDMHAGDELVWGLGLGCDGVIHLLLQRLDRADGFGPLNGMREAMVRRQPALVALVTHSTDATLPLAAWGVLQQGGDSWGDEGLVASCASAVQAGWPGWRHHVISNVGQQIILINVTPQPRVLLCGAGPDAVPVARQIASLDWECVLVDHRPAYARADRFPAGCDVVLSRPEKLPQVVDLAALDAAIIMSHHLENDASYLRSLAAASANGSLAYVGVLGPTTRRTRLKEMADCAELLVHGPVGLDIGAELPEAIALSIAAEIHAVLNQRDGQSLTTGPVGQGGAAR